MLTLAGAASACSNPATGPAAADKAPQATSTWVRPPHVDEVARDGAALVVRGTAGAGARVVLRGLDGVAVAANADPSGRFELRLPSVAGNAVLRPEVQVGEDAAPSPETLVVVAGGAGPVALVAVGQPTERLDGRGVLDAVDSDGATILASGRAEGAPPPVTLGGATVRAVQTPGGWRATAPGGGATSVVIGGQGFDYPGAGSGASGFAVERAGAGWRVVVPVLPQGRQSVWLPDRTR